MHVYKYAITIPFETNVMYEGTQEEIATKIKQYLIDASNDYGIETFIKDCDVDYIGEDDIELTDEDMDNVLITKESLEALKIMLDNGMVELPKEDEE
jgi:hypothetical protein